ncbi:cytosolic thioredoxin Trx1 [Neocallimastix lanati (nom. inval.)]|nr:cytosolic thioredoxin Trx1 [Neocallimastix sp. JGI-2020a]
MITELETMDELNAAIASEKCSVIDFYATWCLPCKLVHPKFESYSNTFKNVNFYQVDVDKAQDIAFQCGIKCMPTFKFYKSGKEFNEILGANIWSLKRIIKKNN